MLYNVELGSRVSSKGDLGTVKWKGNLHGRKGIWLGVDWEEESRGKHNGVYEGIEYFKTRKPTSGSFISPAKLDSGQSFSSALLSKFTHDQDELLNTLESLKKDSNAAFVKFVGFDNKFLGLRNVKSVSVAKQTITGETDLNALEELSLKIEELDLSANLIHSWETIINICLRLKSLKILNLSYTLFKQPPDIQKLRNKLGNLQELYLNHCDLSWSNVVQYSQMWNKLKILHISFNNVIVIDSLPDCMHIQELNLEGNPIEGWLCVQNLSGLPCLEKLNLSGTKINEFPVFRQMFPRLKTLILDNTCFENWEDINPLNNLSSLENLILRNNPITEGQYKPIFVDIVIAKLKGLQNINGCVVSAKCRHDAEIDYLKRHSAEWHGLTDESKASFLNLHPRYPELIDKYGPPDKYIAVNKTLKTDLLSLKIMSENKVIEKSFPKTMKVSKLQNAVTRLLKCHPGNIKLTAQSCKFPEVEIVLDKDWQELSYYELESGDKILVQSNILI